MRLLVVEDDAALRQQLQAALQQAGFAVDVAADGIDGQHLGAVGPSMPWCWTWACRARTGCRC
jgi:two-component system OmpR family response regulator